MTATHRYATARALHDAIKVRAAAAASAGRYDINQLRRHFAYDRFLTRIFLNYESAWVLKGGTSLLARVPRQARHTQDIDLYYRGEIERAEADLIVAADTDLGDFFTFDVERTGTLTGATTGLRYKVIAYIGDTKFADFQIDAVVDSNMTATPDSVAGLRPIDIDGLIEVDYRTHPVVDHLADKLVAMASRYTGDRPSTRFRDLVDIVLIAQTQTVASGALRTAVESELQHRGLSLPERLELPDPSWRHGYAAVAQTVPDLDVLNSVEAIEIAVALYRPVFDDAFEGTWDPLALTWITSDRRS